MEKNISEIKGLAKKVFHINGFSGRMSVIKTTNPDKRAIDNVLIWDNAIIPGRQPVVKIVPSIDVAYVLDRKYDDETMELARLYESSFGCRLAIRYIN
jgi:hypothetical protein